MIRARRLMMPRRKDAASAPGQFGRFTQTCRTLSHPGR
jgi:hypothetical protein